jgi:gas vesicle structural protein
MSPNPRARPRPTAAERILGDDDASLLDIVDNALNKGVVLSGDLTIGLAHVDLVYARLSLLLCAADRIMPGESPEPMERQRARHELRKLRKARRAR